MLSLDLSDPVVARILYTSEDYVPASQKASACGIVVEKWWVDTGQSHGDRSVSTAIVRPWSPEQQDGIRAARALAERFQKQHKRPPYQDDSGWFDEQWWSAHPDQNPLYDGDVEKLHALAFVAFLEAPPAQKPAARPAPPSASAPPPAAEVIAPEPPVSAPALPAPPAPPPPPAAPAAPAPSAPRRAVKRAPAPTSPPVVAAPPPPPPPAPAPPPPAVPAKGKKGAAKVVASPAPAPAPAPVVPPSAPAKSAPAKVSAKAVAKVAAVVASEPPQPRTLELDAARKKLLTVLRMGGWGNEAKLLLQLREKSGVNAIYSASERRFVPLGYTR